jgi:outer membrane protein insertion porin family
MVIAKRLFTLVFGLFFLVSVAEAEMVTIKKIQVEGLHRISLGTFLSYLPVKEGDMIDSAETPDIIRAVYRTGFFSDVGLSIQGNVLHVQVIERAVISQINISGNDKISKKQLLSALKDIGLTEGQVLDSALLSGLEQALVQQYYNLGYYNVKIQVNTVQDKNNSITLNIKIDEGPAAKITKISIIGNKAFDEDTLLKNFSLGTSIWWKPWSDRDQYSREKLDADLERLHSYYMDRGYLRFKIDSAQVSITPDKKHIYIVIHVTEGGVYHVSGVNLTGDFVGKREEILKAIKVKSGDLFSREAIVSSNADIAKVIGDVGYAMPNIKAEPVIDDTNKTIFIKFNVDPGRKVYVRRINFAGNDKTNEYVLRREMRQQEGGLYSLSKVNESKRRLAMLGYLQDVDVKTEPVPGRSDEVDLLYKVKESSSAVARFQAGYSTTDGLIYGASFDEQNIFGTGKRVGVQFDNSSSNQTYSLNYYNPYYTENNVSLKLSAFAQLTNASNADVSSYKTNVYGASAVYGIPLSDYNRFNVGYGYEYTDLSTESNSPVEVSDFVKENGEHFNELKLILGWMYNKLDRAIFTTEGFAQSVSADIYVPPTSDDLSYYEATYNALWYKPLIKGFIFHAKTKIGYGNGYGGTSSLPFYKNFYLGGINSLRGFEGNSIGPKDSNGDPLGGAVVESVTASIILPQFLGDSFRTSVFLDAGNVYDKDFALSQIRSSVGLAFEWRSPIGPISFSLAEPLASYGDSTQLFDFSVGTSF